LFRIDMPDMNILGAITTQGKLIVTGNAQVNGNDAAPTGWTGCGIGAGAAGVAMADQTKLDTKGACSTKGCVDGSPKYLQTPEAGDTATYFVYGNMTYASLAAMAQVKFVGDQNLSNILPVLSGGTCATSVNKNWGDNLRATPAGACERYFPIIHVAGNLQVSQGRGQGILLVDGDVHVTGNFEFAGAIIARGTVTATGTGAKVTGGVLAAAVNWGDESALLGNTAIQYSSCAMEAALSAMAYPKQAKERGWTNLY
jgi:hypothetical protein